MTDLERAHAAMWDAINALEHAVSWGMAWDGTPVRTLAEKAREASAVWSAMYDARF